ncbi:hypothetical protein NDU88_002024 [Pleurodeles waltl]|uniref:Uncharacterized protein n=1 Tax=Pleurodeles waltl TaxID=8319 RepID=A0AAV7T153_PLEWA|nr:hypothetical protein NDU88_002024 [Pleurodeles waltl]
MEYGGPRPLPESRNLKAKKTCTFISLFSALHPLKQEHNTGDEGGHRLPVRRSIPAEKNAVLVPRPHPRGEAGAYRCRQTSDPLHFQKKKKEGLHMRRLHTDPGSCLKVNKEETVTEARSLEKPSVEYGGPPPQSRSFKAKKTCTFICLFSALRRLNKNTTGGAGLLGEEQRVETGGWRSEAGRHSGSSGTQTTVHLLRHELQLPAHRPAGCRPLSHQVTGVVKTRGHEWSQPADYSSLVGLRHSAAVAF